MVGKAAELEAAVVLTDQTSVFHCVRQIIDVFDCFLWWDVKAETFTWTAISYFKIS